MSGCSGDELAEIFRHHFELLVNATAPVHRAIACRLYTAGWISKPTKNDATSTGISPELAAMQVVNDLETNLTTKLRSDPDPGRVIVELCRCLESEINYRTIVQSIRRELCKCQYTAKIVRNKLVHQKHSNNVNNAIGCGLLDILPALPWYIILCCFGNLSTLPFKSHNQHVIRNGLYSYPCVHVCMHTCACGIHLKYICGAMSHSSHIQHSCNMELVGGFQ